MMDPVMILALAFAVIEHGIKIYNTYQDVQSGKIKPDEIDPKMLLAPTPEEIVAKVEAERRSR